MRDQPRIPLWTRILLLATLNVAILGIVFAVFLRLQLKPDFESFLMAESRERIAAITRLVAAELQNTERAPWDGVMTRYSNELGITMLLYRNTGEQLSGVRTPLPPEVDVRMPRGGPPIPPRQGDRRSPPPRHDEGPSPPGRGRPA